MSALSPSVCDQIPAELRALPQWVVWKLIPNKGKVPFNARTDRPADTTDARTWSSFEDALDALGRSVFYVGIGFVFASAGGIFGFDADKLRDPATGVIDPIARAWLDRFATYTEVSPSGTGIHAIGYGVLPGDGKKRAPFEIYDQGRFFTVTGQRVEDYPATLATVNGPLTELWELLAKNDITDVVPAAGFGTSSLTDDQVIEKAQNAANGAKFRALWAGDTSAYGGDDSGADQALCNILAFWCAADLVQMDRLFRRSGLMRDKWDSRRGKSTWGYNTLREAIRITHTIYEGPSAPLRMISNGRYVDSDTGEVIADSAATDPSADEQAPKAEDAPKPKKPGKDLLDAGRRWYVLYHEEWGYDTQSHQWHHWTGTHHQPEQRPSITLDKQAMAVLRQLKMEVSSGSRMDGVIRAAAALSGRTFQTPPNLVNFTNGTLDANTWELAEHDPDHGFTYCLAFDYEHRPYHTIAAFLEQTIPDADGVAAFMAHLGFSLLADCRLHKTLILIGPPRSGKSTLLALANAACGQDPYGNAGPELFSRETEGLRSRATWNSRRIVTLEELPVEALRNEEIIKAMVAHGGVPMRHLWQREAMANRWQPKLLMATNEKPRYSDRTGALTKRIIPISCPNGRLDTAIDPFLLDRLLPELPGFVAACLTTAAVVLESGGVYPMSDAMRDLLADIEQQGDSLKAWVRDRCSLRSEAWERTDVLYGDYRKGCEQNGNKFMAKERFASALCERYASMTPTRHRVNGIPERCIQGVQLLPVDGGNDAVF